MCCVSLRLRRHLLPNKMPIDTNVHTVHSCIGTIRSVGVRERKRASTNRAIEGEESY